MRRLIVLMILLLSVSVIAQQRVPAEIKAFEKKVGAAATQYERDAARAKSAAELAAAINRYAAELEKLVPQAKALEAKYGRLENYYSDDDDEDDDDSFSAAELEALEKSLRYYNDPAVRQALIRLGKVMSEIGIEEDHE